ncbi:synaptic vesicle glycoprotein 2C-like [Anastrepha ludens]|uniref:synaptic vesicle glycoprotein 2C-like n=1 Tax=Anastrepha ludens TaxID=28586 RepID=UPI0023B1FA1C|nr:synaptic vesicle glycoprotein 2C-like [Anastrepha ludens]
MQFSDSKNEGRQPIAVGILEAGNRAGIAGVGASNELEYEFVLARIGFGKTQWILLFISGLLTLGSMATQTSVGIMAIASQCEFGMSQGEKGIMMAACVTGIFLSTYFWGYASDAIGRRSVLFYGMLATNLLQLISMFITNIWAFNVVNLLMGVSLGGVSAAIYAYLGEFNTDKHRAVVINYSTMFVSIAAIYMPATCWLVLSADWSLHISDSFVFRPWRLIILFNLLPGLIGALLLYPFPESPKLLLAQDKEYEAIAALEWICKFNCGRSLGSVLENDTDFKLKPEQIGDDDLRSGGGGVCGILVSIWRATVPLFHKPHCINFILSIVSVFGMFLTSAGMQIWYPEIVNRSSGENAGNSSSVCEILEASFEKQRLNATTVDAEICDDSITTKTYVDNMIVGCAFLVGFAIQGALLNPLGRKNVLLAALAIGTLSGILLHFVVNTQVVLVLFCLYILMPGLSISIMCGAMVDLVPTHLRAKAVSVGLSMGRLGVIVASNMIGVMLEPYCNTTFAILTASILICGFLVHFLPI